MVRLHRTFSIYIVTGETKCAGCLCTSFGVVQAHRTSSNLLEPHHYRTEPSLSTSLQGKQGVQGAYALVRGGSSTSNLLEPHHYRDSKVCRVLSHEFGVVRLYRTSLQGKQGMQGGYALVRGGSSTSYLVEPSPTTSFQR